MKVLDLFSGIGGFSLGLERAGMETVAFCEIEDYPRKVLAKHWPNIPIYEDVRNVTRERLNADGIFPDIITGGFPCQDLSVAGSQKGFDGERSVLYREMLRLISEIRPRYTIFENVTNLVSGNNGEWFARFLSDLAAIGQDAEWHCIRAARVGLPQSRDRVWVVAYPADNDGEERSLPLPGIIGGTQAQLRGLLGLGRGHQEIGDWEMACQPRMVPDINGIPSGMDCLAALGNAVVPQIPEIIGRAIMEIENEPKDSSSRLG